MTNKEYEMIRAWIMHSNKVISFHEVETSEMFEAEKDMFWMYLQGLVACGYKIQQKSVADRVTPQGVTKGFSNDPTSQKPPFFNVFC